MKYAVVIGTNEGREHWVNDLVESLDESVPYIIVKERGYEVGHIRWVYQNTDIDRFIYFQDSFVIKDNKLLLSLLVDKTGFICLMCGGAHPHSYVATYDREILSRIKEIPFAIDKAEAMYYENRFIEMYREVCDESSCYPLNQEITMGVERHGRENMLYSNELYYKYKGNWGQKTAEDYQRDPYM